jgi:hypothetical protein
VTISPSTIYTHKINHDVSWNLVSFFVLFLNNV